MKRTLRSVYCGLLLVFLVGQSHAAEVFSTSEAERHVGERVTVELVILGSGRNGEYQELHSTKD